MTSENILVLPVVLSLVALVIVLAVGRTGQERQGKLKQIPTVGPSGFLLSYIGAIRFLYDARGMLQEGYERDQSGIFKVANFNQWIVVVCGTKYIEELRKAPDEDVSFVEAANEIVQIPYTLGKGISSDPYHVHVLATQLTRNMHTILPGLRDEVVSAVRNILPSTEHDWVPVPGLNTMTQVITRVSNRIFVGLPLCREPHYLALCASFSRKVLTAAVVISMSPKILRPLISHSLAYLPGSVRTAQRFLQPVIEERREKIQSYGKNYPQRPNDLLTWLMTDVKGLQASSEDLVSRIMAVNFAAIRTSSMNMTHVLYHLAARPEYIEPMRREVEAIVKAGGWTKSSIDRMYKLDSFIKESMRVSNLRFLSMMRKTTKPFIFSDGTEIPEGTMIFAASHPVHFDSSKYHNAREFDGFRFVDLQQRRGSAGMDDGGARHQLVTTTTDYLAWGYGRRACPGRFFAGIELKLILAHLVMNYDLRLEQPGERPRDFVFEANCLPNSKANILFRRREVQAL
ncbi:hypothetical protein AX17_000458 [Amanita inopinata Kibby_2008]|nr:hypothetical protein AX17_000458 [Amanita inopinata Kibby_2008]